jgi:hypothetical protein
MHTQVFNILQGLELCLLSLKQEIGEIKNLLGMLM